MDAWSGERVRAARARVRAEGRRARTRALAAAARGRRSWWQLTRATVVIFALTAKVLLTATLASPRWARVGTGFVDRVTACRVYLVAGALLLLGYWLMPSIVGATLCSLALVPVAARIARAVYPHTVRGRVRVKAGGDGWASFWELHRHLSAQAVRTAAAETRPSLLRALPAVRDDAARSERAAAMAARRALIGQLPITDCGTWLGRSAVGPLIGTDCYVPHRDVVGLIAPPQTGKSALLGHHVIDHPGAVISTSTKPDLYAYTSALRARRAMSGRVELFNPEGLSGLSSTFRWSPVAGCDQPAVAAERAAALVGATSAAGGEDGTFWLDSAAKVLRCFLMAAALDDRTMSTVYGWVTSPTDTADEALSLLERVHAYRVPDGWAGELRQVLKTDARRTRESIFLTLSQSVAFMADPAVAAICTPGPDHPVFDVASLLEDCGTVYILGSERPHASVAPLLAALTSHVFEEAKRIASTLPGGRLDGPLLFALDEAALITPVPLDRWTADAGGRGIHIIWAVQSPSQLAQRWGARGADTIWNNSNAKLIYGGLTLESDLEAISRLCGERLELVDGPTGGRFDRVRMLPPDRLRTLPQWHALLIHRATPPTIVRIWPVWKRRDVIKGGEPLRVEPIRGASTGWGAPRSCDRQALTAERVGAR